MKKFFVPGAWEKNTETLKFKTIKGNLGGSSKTADSGTTKKSKNKKNKKAKSAAGALSGKGPLAPKPDTPTKTDPTPPIKSGRIEKRKNEKKQKKLKLTPAMSKAAAEAFGLGVSASAEAAALIANTPPATGTSAFADKLKQELQGGRFRYLNEQLYTMDSAKAAALFRNDKDAFGAYHVGYRGQVEKWPLNPLDRIIKMVRRLPKSLEIGDFGCGDGRLAEAVPHKVYSMDLVSARPDIIACDMAATPLTTHSLDVAVYCLSLMGTNLNDYLLEANRVLKLDGLVYIAEIQSRFDEGDAAGGKNANDVRHFVRALEACGFELVRKDVGVKLFYFFQFKKVRHVGKVAVLPTFTLKPCLYRKR